MDSDLKKGIDKLFVVIKDDYLKWSKRVDKGSELSDVSKNMIDNFNKGLKVAGGKKYIKIVKDDSVWGFIVANDGGKFKRGDILKAASWKAPALNKARGNVLDGDFKGVQWTGPAYLK